MRRLALIALLGALPMPAGAYLDLWHCDPAERFVCSAHDGCHEAAPQIDQLQIMPNRGRIEFCIGEQCFEGVLSLEHPDPRRMGTAWVEALPLPRHATEGFRYFAAFEEEARRFALSTLWPRGQDTSWFACRKWEPT